jgi:putative acetyltransferase
MVQRQPEAVPVRMRRERPPDAAAIRAVVLGHPECYPRFGFVPARTFGITCEYPVPDEVFMARDLIPAALSGRGGIARYRPEFSAV